MAFPQISPPRNPPILLKTLISSSPISIQFQNPFNSTKPIPIPSSKAPILSSPTR
ncbi:Methylmalonyl-CoA mutase [Bienertia sinuspersici]